MTAEPLNPTAAPASKGRGKLLIIIALVAAVIGLGAWVWDSQVKNRVFPKRWGVVEPRLIFRSGQIDAGLIEGQLCDKKIATVVDLTGDDPENPDQVAELAAVKKLGIEHRRFPLRGNGTGDIRSYAGAIAAIHEQRQAGKAVLVHCSAGSQRTGGVVASYRLLVEQKTDVPAILAEMQEYDWRPKRDAILLDYLNEHLPELAQMLVDAHVIDHVPATIPRLAP
ncbi:MAG: tyrosine-protein phosphatase [Planctomycetota bacterium]|nr:tyrosine-protein phosphatase [Planctomycetota bacterium]